ncbi:MAG: class I SAM-dependent methyltransferase [Bacteroidota bacterium]
MSSLQTISTENIRFYEMMAPRKFLELAQLTGFDTNPDLKLILPQLRGCRSIAELGVGYGRCVFGLRELGFNGKIYAVDRVQMLLDRIQDTFDEDVIPLLQDIRELNLPEPADAIIWLWSGILEQKPENQLLSLKQIRHNLAPDGKLFVDSPEDKIKYVGKKLNQKHVRVEMEWGGLDGYIPYREDMEYMAEEAGYSNIEVIPYKSETDLDRLMYVLSR